MKCICNLHLVPGDTAQRPFRTGQDRGVCSPFTRGPWGRLAVSSARSTGTGHSCFTANVVAVVSSTVGVHAGSPG